MMKINNQKIYAVVGVSKNPQKYGYKVYKKLLSNGFTVYPINPKHSTIDNKPCFSTLIDVPASIDIVVTLVPPQITTQLVKDFISARVKLVWMQPGSQSKAAIQLCQENNIEVISNSCIITDGLKQSFS